MNGSSLQFKWEWEQGDGVAIPEHRTTWARLEIWLADECITLVEDKATLSARRSIYCALYPIAEWITSNWWLLRADARVRELGTVATNPTTSERLRSLAQRHNLRFAGDGFVWPDLTIVPEGRQTFASWRRDRHWRPYAPIRYLAEGEAYLDGDEVKYRLGEFVEAVLGRLNESGLTETDLHAEWKDIRETEPEVEAFCLAAARLGLDPYWEAHDVEAAIVEAVGRLPDSLLEDFLDAVDTDLLTPAAIWVNKAQRTLERVMQPTSKRAGEKTQGDILDLRQTLAADVGLREGMPWEIGYAYARQVRELLHIAPAEPVPVDSYVHSVLRSGPDPSLTALGLGHSTAVVLSQRQAPEPRRFTLARVIWHLLSSSGDPFLITAAHTERQSVERAFAAEFLAPAAGIQEVMGTSTGTDPDEVARYFRVSPLVVYHQVENQLLHQPH
jgi:hypothetical protein